MAVLRSTGVSKPKQHGGRPTKYSPATVRAITDAVADGMPYRLAAALGGISIDTFHEWQKRFPEFSDAIKRALARGVHERLKLIKAAARKGNVRVAMWWLEHVLPGDFALTRVERPGVVDISVKPEISEDLFQRMHEAYKKKVRREIEEEMRQANSKSNPAS
jgi:hypothetical protein